ncbi:MAG: GNAT family N-acetyltransferase [Hyphomicrobiales bacterium]|nr:GNAT family N-acetyltransferase [Hyphomicrobiales bacterium]
MSAAPILTTERTILRPHKLDDFPDMAAMWADPEVVRHISGKPSTETETWFRLLRYAGHWDLLGYGYWAVTDRASGAFLGEAGLADYRRDIEPDFRGAPEAGWVMATASHGRGLAREAVTAILAWADENLSAIRTVCMISPEHDASLRLAKDVGYVNACQAKYMGSDVVVLERARSTRP